MPELKLARDFLARGVAYLIDPGTKHPVRADVQAQLPRLIEQVQAVIVEIGKLIGG